MALQWLRERRRKKLLEEPFPDTWRQILRERNAHFAWLDDAERTQLCQLVQVFVAEKNFQGCGGLELTDEIRVTIAADACLLVLALPHDLYRSIDTILVYPTTVVQPPRALGLMEVATMPMGGGMPILGEAHMRGPVILTWDAVRRGARHPERGHNVVIHEFAHKLDMLDSQADGTPPLEARADYARWAQVCSASFLALRERTERGESTALDPYGATNEAEFFAVATEAFFNVPSRLRRDEPALYEVLRGFYRQDPASRVGAAV
ncbi:MAG: zinc-dependent peptidase [Deltaproteobacteria bacterium]|nr:zinc-dependent peptidase [Deltaproteobacteria bacterium]